jgi:hypothetical protein
LTRRNFVDLLHNEKVIESAQKKVSFFGSFIEVAFAQRCVVSHHTDDINRLKSFAKSCFHSRRPHGFAGAFAASVSAFCAGGAARRNRRTSVPIAKPVTRCGRAASTIRGEIESTAAASQES